MIVVSKFMDLDFGDRLKSKTTPMKIEAKLVQLSKTQHRLP